MKTGIGKKHTHGEVSAYSNSESRTIRDDV